MSSLIEFTFAAKTRPFPTRGIAGGTGVEGADVGCFPGGSETDLGVGLPLRGRAGNSSAI